MSLSGKLVNQRDIANHAGVSTSTVSRVLNNLSGISDAVRQQVFASAAELGYEDKRTSGHKEAQHVILFTTTRMTSGHALGPFHADILNGVEEECKRLGLHLSYAGLDRGRENSAIILEMVRKNNIDGILLLSVDDRALVEELLELRLATILINVDHAEPLVDAYLPDNWGGPWLAMRHLLGHGHRHILHVTHVERRTIQRRHEVYRAALQDAGIEYDPALILDTSLSPEATYEAMTSYLKGQPHFTAVFCANDLMAIGVMRALQEAGKRIPDDISVVGFDDISMAAFTAPPLTTIRVDRQMLGALAVRGLLERISSPDPRTTPIRVELASKLVQRRSVARVSALVAGTPSTSPREAE